MIGLLCVFLFCAGVAEGFMDFLNFRYTKNHPFWNVEQSSINKWKKKLWIKHGIKKERFPGSSTVLVFLTDGWHLMKWIRNRFIDAAVYVLLVNVGYDHLHAFGIVVAFRIIYGISFMISFEYIHK